MMHYISEGNPENPALMLLHGFGGLSSDWQQLIGQYANDYYCVAPDLPGHGQTKLDSAKDVISLESVAADLHKLVAKLGLEHLILLGYSMGGRVALRYAINHGDALQGLILESAHPGLENDYERNSRTALDKDRANRLRNFGAEDFFEEWYHQPLFDSISEQSHLVAALIESRMKQDAASLAAIVENLSPGRQTPMWGEIDKLHMPVKLLSGAKDREYTRVCRRMDELIPHSDWTVIADAGHNCHLEQPLAYATAVKRFIEERILVTG